MNKAIFNYYGMDSTVGGPRGYISNLYRGLEETGINPPQFICGNVVKTANKSSDKNISKTAPSDLRCTFAFVKKGLKIRTEFKHMINNYGIIHVHSTEDCYYLRRFAGFKGKIVLTSHSPEPLSSERIAPFKNSNGKNYFLSRNIYNYVESRAYKYANAFIYPSKGAMEIYKKFPGFEKYSQNKPLHYVMTGAPKKINFSSREEYRKKQNIADDAFVISFIGRHNHIKGYDRVVNAFERFKQENIVVVAAGARSNDIEPPKDVLWTELGYINDAVDLMKASDIVVIPNRNTYYDLVIIEALSERRIVISSNTGGNIDIAKHTDGLILFDNNIESDFADKVISIKRLSKEERFSLENSSYEFYIQHGTIGKFAECYDKEFNSICKELGFE